MNKKENIINRYLPYTVYLIPITYAFTDEINDVTNKSLADEINIITSIGLFLIIVAIRIYKNNKKIKENYYRFLLYIGIVNVVITVLIIKLIPIIGYISNIMILLLILLIEALIHKITYKETNKTENKDEKIKSVEVEGIVCGIIAYILSNIQNILLILFMLVVALLWPTY